METTLQNADDFLTHDNYHLSEPNQKLPLPSKVTPTVPARKDGSAVARYLQAATSRNTHRAYQADLRHFHEWGGTIPADANMVAEYLAAHAEILAVPTLIRRLATISKTHTLRGHESPTKANLVRTVMRGIKRTHGRQPQQKAAVLTEQIIAMVGNIGTRRKDMRDRALLLVGFAGGFRRSELVALKCTDIEWAAEGIIINLRRSKCDQEGIGRQVVIPSGQGTCCPVRALGDWLSVSGIESGSIFRAVNRHGHTADKALSPEAVALVIKARAKAAGMDPRRYSGHSLRAGLATSAAAAGVASWKIRRQTGHASEAMLERYIRDGNRFNDNAVVGLL